MSTAYERIVDALRANGRNVIEHGGDKAQAQCPTHDDHNPSLSIYPRKDGKGTQIKCHVDCDYRDVLTAIGLMPRDLYDDEGMRNAHKPNTDYIYPNGDRRRRRTGPDGIKHMSWQKKGRTGGRALYLADKIPRDCPLVFLVESEKAAQAIWAMGAVAVATGGATRSCDMEPLRGIDVAAVVDRDGAGLKWAARQRKVLNGVAASLRFVRCPVDMPKADTAEHIDVGLDLAQLEEFDPATTSYDEPAPAVQTEPVDGAELLDDLVTWWARFIAVTHSDDLFLLALWAVHTHLVNELYTTPRLLIDSIMEGSGKSTVIDHLNRLCLHPVQAATISSPALIPRLLESGMRTILLDEAHRALRPDKPGVDELLGIINTGYRHGATRPVLVPTKGGAGPPTR